MWDFSLGAALTAMLRTAPFIVLRMLVYFGIALLYIIATGVGGAIGYGVTSFSDSPGGGAGWGAFIGFAGASGFLYWIREYILYLVKAGHIAVLVKVHDGQKLPQGRDQINYAQDVVKQRFTEASVLFGLDQLIKGVLRFITGTISIVSMILPIPGLQNLIAVVNAILKQSLTFVDEVILAHNIRTESENPWQTSCQAVVLYAQNYPKFLKNAVWLWLFSWALTLVVFLLVVGPVLALMALFPGDFGFWAFLSAFIFAWSFKAALIEPVAMYAMMQVYFRVIEGQRPDPVWEQRLEQASAKFRKMQGKAADWVRGSAASKSAA